MIKFTSGFLSSKSCSGLSCAQERGALVDRCGIDFKAPARTPVNSEVAHKHQRPGGWPRGPALTQHGAGALGRR